MTKQITAEQLQDLLPSWVYSYDFDATFKAEKEAGLEWDEDKFHSDADYKAKWTKLWDENPPKELIGKPDSFVRDGKLFLSNETARNQDMGVFDPYNELKRDNDISQHLLNWAESLGTYFEAQDMATIVLDPQDVDPIKFKKLVKGGK